MLRSIRSYKKRDELSHAVAPIEQWPMFSMEFARLPDGSNRLFVGFDLLIADAFSFLVLGVKCPELTPVKKFRLWKLITCNF